MKHPALFAFTLVLTSLAVCVSTCTLSTASGCSTSVASGLTNQLVEELESMGVSFSRLSDSSRFRCSSPCVPFLQQGAKQALEAATRSVNDYITLNSAYRSSAQQYLLYRWYQNGQCGIPIAARPGSSRHEDGLAIDVSFYNYWKLILSRHSWAWYGPGDRVHFTYTGSGSSSGVRSLSLEAFQKLWNRNNRRDQIDTDGIYGPQTAARLARAPCSGW